MPIPSLEADAHVVNSCVRGLLQTIAVWLHNDTPHDMSVDDARAVKRFIIAMMDPAVRMRTLRDETLCDIITRESSEIAADVAALEEALERQTRNDLLRECVDRCNTYVELSIEAEDA